MELKDLKDIVINCQTKKEAKRCCKLANKLGWKWWTGMSYTDNCWYWFANETCYAFERGKLDCCSYYMDNNYTIKSAQWFLDNFKINKDMEERNIKVSLDTAKEWFKGSDKTLKQLSLQAYKEEELNKEEVKVWEDLVNNELEIPTNSCLIGSGSELIKMCIGTFENTDKNIFIDERHAKSALAMSQISQLMSFYGGAITKEEWSNSKTDKYVIMRIGNDVIANSYSCQYQFLAFHTREQRDDFMRYNERLVKDYLMLD